MSTFSLLKEVLATGRWKRCLFCRRACPTREHTKSPGFNKGAIDGNEEIIEASGYCSYCERHGLTTS